MRTPKLQQNILADGRVEYLERYINHESALVFDNSKCIDCGFCQIVCPREAIKEKIDQTHESGSLQYIVDQQKCNYCGVCQILCPTDALTLLIKGEPRLIIQETKVMPLIESVPIEVGGKVIKKFLEGSIAITPRGKLTKQMSELLVNCCPTRAIEIEGQQVNVSNENCIFCTRCSRVATLHQLPFTITVFRSSIHRKGHDVSTLWNDVAARLLGQAGKIEGMKGDISYKIADRVIQLMKSLKKDLLPNSEEK